MRVIVGFMFLIGVALGWILYKFDFSPIQEAIIISLIVGVVTFILVSGLIYSGSGSKRNKNLDNESSIRRRKRRAHTIGFIVMVASIFLFLSFYLYFKSLVGNDLLVSLDVEEQNFFLKNWEEARLGVKARVLTNPFCSANCSFVLEDLSEDKRLVYEEVYVKSSSPISKEYILTSNGEKYGQKLYKLSLECNSVKDGKLCYVNNNLSKLRTRIISVNYELNDVQNLIKNALKNETEGINRDFYTAENILNRIELDISPLNLSEFEDTYESLKNNSGKVLESIQYLNYLYSKQEYSKLGTEISGVKEETESFFNSVVRLNNSISSSVIKYNSLIENVSLIRLQILFLEDYNFTEYSLSLAESFVGNFNSMVSSIEQVDTIENKLSLFNLLWVDKENLLFVLENESLNEVYGDERLNLSIYSTDFKKIYLNYSNYASSFSLEDPLPICCFMNECYECIDDSSLKYPVILVHGHSFNEKLSAELSMESFSDMARNLEKEGYLDAGYFYRSQYDEASQGYLGKINNSIVVEATYYLDTAVTEESSFIYDSKLESIDTYATRLNEIISNVKYLTGKDKVIIIGHSMGCLVTRRYIQLYGDDSLHKVVLVGGPNNGIDGLVLNSCAVFGADIECSEMNKSSSFISELSSAPIPSIPVYNIIGLGCPFEGSNSDGIVKNESAYLYWADNIYVNGTCTGVDFFHVKMIKPTYYPDIYEIVKSLIKE